MEAGGSGRAQGTSTPGDADGDDGDDDDDDDDDDGGDGGDDDVDYCFHC